jgi:antitoxin VapB
MTERKRIKPLRCGRDQVVRIPVEFELTARDVFKHREGVRLVIEPVRQRGLLALLKTMKPLEESFLEIEDIFPSPESPL